MYTRLDGWVGVTPTVDCGCRSLLGLTVSVDQDASMLLASMREALEAEFGDTANVPDAANPMAYANGRPTIAVDRAGLRTWIVVVDRFETESALPGHVFIRIDGDVYSWETEGLRATTWARYEAYMRRNGMDATSFELDTTTEAEQRLRTRLDSLRVRSNKNELHVLGERAKNQYNILTNNCGDVAVRYLNEAGMLQSVDEGDAWTPAEYREKIVESLRQNNPTDPTISREAVEDSYVPSGNGEPMSASGVVGPGRRSGDDTFAPPMETSQ